MTQGVERIPDSLGHLIITEDGAVVSSGGELENDEKTADKLLQLTLNALRISTTPDQPSNFKRLSIVWDDVMYIITVSNHRIYVTKRQHIPQEPAVV